MSDRRDELDWKNMGTSCQNNYGPEIAGISEVSYALSSSIA